MRACRRTRTAASSSPPKSSTARSRPRRSPSRSTTATASRTPNIGGWNVHFIPGSSGLKIMDHRTGETRLANSTDFVEYARLCDGLAHIPYLATAFSTNHDIEPQVSDAWRLYMVLTNTKKPVVSGAFGEHGVPRMARDDAALPPRPRRAHREADVDLHDHRDRQLPLRRGLLPEPARLRRGRHPGRDRAGHAHGPDRAGHAGRRARVPLRGRADRHHDGADREAGRAGAVRRRAGDLPHARRERADGGDRGAAPERRLRRDREVARPADAGLHGALATASSSTRRRAPRR